MIIIKTFIEYSKKSPLKGLLLGFANEPAPYQIQVDSAYLASRDSCVSILDYGTLFMQCNEVILIDNYGAYDVVLFWQKIVEMVRLFLAEKSGVAYFVISEHCMSIDYIDSGTVKVTVNTGNIIECVMPLKEFLIAMLQYVQLLTDLVCQQDPSVSLYETAETIESLKKFIIIHDVTKWWKWIVCTLADADYCHTGVEHLISMRDMDNVIKHVFRADIRGYLCVEYLGKTFVEKNEKICLVDGWTLIVENLEKFVKTRSPVTILHQMTLMWCDEYRLQVVTHDNTSIVVDAKECLNVLSEAAFNFFDTMNFVLAGMQRCYAEAERAHRLLAYIAGMESGAQ